MKVEIFSSFNLDYLLNHLLLCKDVHDHRGNSGLPDLRAFADHRCGLRAPVVSPPHGTGAALVYNQTSADPHNSVSLL